MNHSALLLDSRKANAGRQRNVGGWFVHLGLAVLGVWIAPTLAMAQLNENCTIAVLNRTAQVNSDGTWVLPNIPANFGLVRARATCIQNGATVFGQSDLFLPPKDLGVDIPKIVLGSTTPIPISLTMGAPKTTLTTPGATTQVAVTALYTGGTTKNVTAAASGTQYRTSNPDIATVGGDGLITARRSGTAIVQAVNEGTQGLLNIQVLLSVDSDGDGIPDDAEKAMGLDPNDPTDAMLDLDHDGLTNLREFQLGTDPRKTDTDGDGLTDGQEVLLYHTNPLVADTDGDGVPDGVEIQTGTDPLNQASRDLKKAISSLEVKPSVFLLDVNALQGEASQQLTVLAHLIDGKTDLDMTSTQTGTNYASSNLQVCNFGSPDGRVFAGSAGNCTITVTNNGFTATASGVVTGGFTPTAWSFLTIPGFANGIAVSGNFAYVAAGSAGLQVVDVTDRSQPKIVASLALAGNANDVKVVNNIAFVAAGSTGLHAVDVSNPLAPVLRGTVGTGTGRIALHVAVQGTVAYVANTSNLFLADISNPAAMTQLSTLTLSGKIQGLDVLNNLAVVAAGTSGIYTVDVTNRLAPVLRGSLGTGDARAVAIRNNFAYVADFLNSTVSVDISVPTSPVRRSNITDPNLGGFLNDIVLSGNFAYGADVKFVNGVPITDISVPTSLQARAILNFPQRDDNGMGITVDGQFLYLLTEHTAPAKFGSNGDSRLYIGRYQVPPDTNGIPPAVTITSPSPGSIVYLGSTLEIDVSASDDVAVTGVTFFVNGQQAFTATAPPYQFFYSIPSGISSLTLSATATDPGSNVGTAVPVVVLVQNEIAPQAISSVSLPNLTIVPPGHFEYNGFANGIALANGAAYVAGGAAGVLFFSVADPAHPLWVNAVDTPGNANSVRAVGTNLFVADGTGGLQIISTVQIQGTPPQLPHIVGSLSLPGVAWDVAVYDNVAYVAAGSAGLQIIDVSNLAAPTLLGSVAIPGTAKAVDVDPDRKIAVVAAGTSGAQIVDVSNRQSPVRLAGVSLLDLTVGHVNPDQSDARGVVIRGNAAFLAANGKSFVSVNIADPAHPVQLVSTPHTTGGWLQDIAVSGRLALGADTFSPNHTPIIDITSPTVATPLGTVNFSVPAGYWATNIAADGRYVYVTGEPSFQGVLENGVGSPTSNPGAIFIGQYRTPQDASGVAPTVSIAYPAQGMTFRAGDTIPIRVVATDDAAVTGVQFLINGQPIDAWNHVAGLDVGSTTPFTDSSEPYQITYKVPSGVSSLTISARATDLGGNTGTAPTVTVTIAPAIP